MIDLKLLRANSATSPTAAAYAGPQGEVVVDTDTYCLRVQDGSTPGGHEICPGGSAASMHRVTTGTSDTLSSLPSPYVVISWTSATAGAKSQAIPAANAVTDGSVLVIKMGPAVSGLLTVTPASGTIDTASNAQFSAPGSATLIADHTNNDWLVT